MKAMGLEWHVHERRISSLIATEESSGFIRLQRGRRALRSAGWRSGWRLAERTIEPDAPMRPISLASAFRDFDRRHSRCRSSAVEMLLPIFLLWMSARPSTRLPPPSSSYTMRLLSSASTSYAALIFSQCGPAAAFSSTSSRRSGWYVRESRR